MGHARICKPAAAMGWVDVYGSCYRWDLSGCPGSGQLPETILVSEGLASAEAIMICVTCAANGASHEVQAQATAETWLGLCTFKSKGHTEPVPPDTGPGVADAPPH